MRLFFILNLIFAINYYIFFTLKIPHMKLFFISLVLFFVSCNHDVSNYMGKNITKNLENNTLEFENLNSEVLSINLDSIVLPLNEVLLKDYLIIADVQADKTIHILDIKKQEYLGSFIQKGEGGGEISTPWSITDIGNNSILIYDATLRKSVSFSIDSLLKGKYNYQETVIEESAFFGLGSVHLSNNTFFYTMETSGRNRVYTKTGIEKVKGYGTLLKLEKDYGGAIAAQLSTSIMKKKGENMVFAYQHVPLIEFFNIKKNKWTSILGPEVFDPIYSADLMEDGVYAFTITRKTLAGYSSVCITEKNVYALFSGEVIVDGFYNCGNKVYVFDLDGNIQKKYLLDEKVTSISVKNDSIMYAMKVEIKPELLSYKL